MAWVHLNTIREGKCGLTIKSKDGLTSYTNYVDNNATSHVALARYKAMMGLHISTRVPVIKLGMETPEYTQSGNSPEKDRQFSVSW